MCAPTSSRSESYPKSKLSVEVSHDDSDVLSVVAVGVGVFVHLLDVRAPRVGEIHTGQFDLALVARDCCDDHPFADVLCLNDLSFSISGSRVFQLRAFERSHQRP